MRSALGLYRMARVPFADLNAALTDIFTCGCKPHERKNKTRHVFYVPLVGLNYRTETARYFFNTQVKGDTHVYFEHEPTLHDENAMKVLCSGYHIGYVHPDYSHLFHASYRYVDKAFVSPHKCLTITFVESRV